MLSDPGDVQDELSSGAAERLHALDVFDVVPSTNTWLIDQSPPEPGQYRVAIARHQTRFEPGGIALPAG